DGGTRPESAGEPHRPPVTAWKTYFKSSVRWREGKVSHPGLSGPPQTLEETLEDRLVHRLHGRQPYPRQACAGPLIVTQDLAVEIARIVAATGVAQPAADMGQRGQRLAHAPVALPRPAPEHGSCYAC